MGPENEWVSQGLQVNHASFNRSTSGGLHDLHFWRAGLSAAVFPWNHDFQPSWLSIFDRKKNIPWEESSQDLFFHVSVSIIPTFHLGRNHISSFLRVLKESSVGIFRDPRKDIGRPLRAPIYSSLIPRTVKNRLRV